MATQSKLEKTIRLVGRIRTLSGLHIGASGTNMAIGGADATVIRNPLSNEPYIPGSSLKGKMRSLLERAHIPFLEDTTANLEYSHITTRLFGTTPEELKKQQLVQPVGRIIVRDCHLTVKSRNDLLKCNNTTMPFTEVKAETTINRISSQANPRQLERVPKGVEFDFDILIKIYTEDNEDEYFEKTLEGLLLVQNDYLGGKGTRGSGQVHIIISSIEERTVDQFSKFENWVDAKRMDQVPDELKAIPEGNSGDANA